MSKELIENNFAYPSEQIEKALNTEIHSYKKDSLRNYLFEELSEYLKDPECHRGKSFAEMVNCLGEAVHILEPESCHFGRDDDWHVDNWKLFDKALVEILRYLFYRK